MLDRPRHHHYLFAHRELASAAHRFGADLVAAARDGRLTLATVWDRVGETVPEPERLPSTGLATSHHPLERHEVLLVTLPAPDAPTEAYFTAVTVSTVDGQLRYLTLESAYSPVDGARYTVLGEWTDNGSHINHGAGPEPRPELFLAAVRREVSG